MSQLTGSLSARYRLGSGLPGLFQVDDGDWVKSDLFGPP
jgi:hypothetical protein